VTMWLRNQMALASFVWPLLVTCAISLSTNFQSTNVSSVAVTPQRPTRRPVAKREKEQHELSQRPLEPSFYRWHVPSGLQPATERQAPPKRHAAPPTPDGLLPPREEDAYMQHKVHFLGLTTEPLALYSTLASSSDQLFLISLVLGVMLLGLALVCLYGEEKSATPLPSPHGHGADRFAEFSTIYEHDNEKDYASDCTPPYQDQLKDDQRESMKDTPSPYMPETKPSPYMQERNQPSPYMAERNQSPCLPEINLKDTLNTRANLKLLETPGSALDYQGTWAKAYRKEMQKADTGGREPFQLLFLAGIIPFNEFANSYVSQEHIDECIWISLTMLRQRSLAEWVQNSEQAMKTFEESVTACFAARTDVLCSLYGTSAPNSPKPPDNGQEAPGSPRSDRGMIDCCTPPGTVLQPMAPPTQINLQRGGLSPPSLGPPTVAHMPPLRSTPTTLNTLSEEQIPGTVSNLRASGARSNPSSTCNSASNSPAQPTTIVLFQDRQRVRSPRKEEYTPEPMRKEHDSP